ncbi:MAG TPA: alpha/beta fold hydrolase [Bacteroidia bacterium]|jgi:esterase/lipase
MQHLLLLHGAIGAKDQLAPLSEELKNNFIIHTINFSGHGGEPMPEIFSIELFAEDVLRYLKNNNLESINIFGYSMGGYVALYLAKHHPKKIKKVFTLATKFAWSPEISQKEIKMLDAEKIAEKVPAFAAILEKKHQPNDWKIVLQKTVDMMVALGNDSTLISSDFKSIQIPVKLSIGDNDTMVSLEETEEVCNYLSDAKLIIFPDTAHPIEKVNIEKLSAELKTFF